MPGALGFETVPTSRAMSRRASPGQRLRRRAADLRKANLRRALLDEANLRYADLSGADRGRVVRISLTTMETNEHACGGRISSRLDDNASAKRAALGGSPCPQPSIGTW